MDPHGLTEPCGPIDRRVAARPAAAADPAAPTGAASSEVWPALLQGWTVQKEEGRQCCCT